MEGRRGGPNFQIAPLQAETIRVASHVETDIPLAGSTPRIRNRTRGVGGVLFVELAVIGGQLCKKRMTKIARKRSVDG